MSLRKVICNLLARQWFDANKNAFHLDLHGVLTADAARVIEKRIGECCKFGIDNLYVIYGTPNVYDGSIAKHLWRITNESIYIDREGISEKFLHQPDQFSTRVPELRLPIRRAPSACAQDEHMSFVGFKACREPDRWRRRSCGVSFLPLKRWFTLSEVAAFAGPNYNAECVSRLLDDFKLTAIVSSGENGRLLIPSHNLEEIVMLLWRGEVSHATVGMQSTTRHVERQGKEAVNAALLEFEDIWQPAVQALNSRDYARAEKLLQCCLPCAEKHFAHDQIYPTVLKSLAQCYSAMEKSEDAKDYFSFALDWNGQPVEKWAQLRADIGTDFAAHLENQSDLRGAADVWRGVQADRIRSADGEGELTALANEADIRCQLGDYAEAESLYSQAVARARHNNSSGDVLAPLLLELGRVRAVLCSDKDALPLFRKAISLSENPELLISCRFECAQIYFEAGESGKARRLLNEVIENARSLASWSEDYLWALNVLGRIHFFRSELAKAESCFVEITDRLSERGATAGKLVWHSHFWAAKVYEANSKPDAAQTHYEKAIALLDSSVGADANMLVEALVNLTALYSESGRRPDAANLLLKASKVLHDSMPEIEPHTAARMYRAIGLRYAALDDFVKAEEQCRCALALEESVEIDCVSIAQTLLLLAKILLFQKRYTNARPVCKRVIDVLESAKSRTIGIQHLLGGGYAHMGAALRGMGNEKGAQRMFSRAADFGHPECVLKHSISLGEFGSPTFLGGSNHLWSESGTESSLDEDFLKSAAIGETTLRSGPVSEVRLQTRAMFSRI
jgi:tetratricopeptide (TPR) repeat protein